jgi:hypothetical protein
MLVLLNKETQNIETGRYSHDVPLGFEIIAEKGDRASALVRLFERFPLRIPAGTAYPQLDLDVLFL